MNKVAAIKPGAREFVIDTVVVAVTQLLLKMRGLITIPLIVKILGTSEYGVWVQVLTFIAFTGSLLSGNLHVPLVRFIAGDSEHKSSIYSSILILTVVGAALGGLVMCLFANQWSLFLLGQGGYASYIYLGILIMFFGNVRQINLNVYRATGRLKIRSVSELFTTFGQLTGICMLLWSGYNLLQVFIFMAIWEGSIATLQSLHVLSLIGWEHPRRAIVRDAMRYALPLIPAAVSAWALDRSDRFMIGYFLGPAAVGVYSANYALGSLLMSFQMPFQVTLLPKVASLWDKDQEAAKRYISMSIRFFFTLAIPFVFSMLVIAPALLHRIGNNEIAAAAGLNTFLIAGGVLFWGVTLMQNQIFHGARQTKVIGVTNLAAAVTNIVLNLALVPLIGIAGSALATLVTYLGLFFVYARICRPIMRLNFYSHYLFKCCIAAAPMMLVFYYFTPLASTRRLATASVIGGLVYLSSLLILRAFSPSEMERIRQFARRKLNIFSPGFSW